jgi:two-component system, cell cycle sensor histidine kinase and response regulator CckA
VKSSPGPRLAAALILVGVLVAVAEASVSSTALNGAVPPADVSAQWSAIAGSTPQFLWLFVIFAFLALGQHYRQKLLEAREKLKDLMQAKDQAALSATSLPSDATFRALVDRNLGPLILFDGQGTILYCNQASERVLGYPPETLMGRSGFHCIHADDQEKVRTTVQRAIETPGSPVTARARVLHKDGSTRLVEGTFNNLLHDPHVQAVVNNYRDVTEEAATEVAWRESEERFAKAFRSGPLAISISTQADGRYLDVNEAYLEMLGYERAEVIGASVAEMSLWADPEDRARLLRRLADASSIKGLRTRLRTKSGEIREVSVSAELIELDGTSCVLAITQDITEARRLEDHLRQVQKMEALGRLAGGVAHDFNNMLGVIMGYSEISMDRLDAAHPLYKNLTEIKKGAERAASLTRQLLAFTRQQVLYPRVLDLNAVMNDLNQMLQRMIGEDVTLSFKPADSLGSVKLDRGQIEQILMNLVINARDAMPSGGRITIETSNVEVDDGDLGSYFSVRPGHYVLLSVSDTGCGMDQKTMANIFEPFFTTKGLGEGTGLGLATVYGIVKQSEGYILVYSEPGKGTSFKLYFPRYDEARPEGLADHSVEAEAAQGSGTILVVEDDESLRKLTVRFLEGAGYRVLQAASSEAAVQLIERFTDSIDLLLTDIIMPLMSGMDIAAHAHVLRPDLKVMMMSGYAGDYTARYGVMEAGVSLLEKPFTRRQLLARVSETLHKQG